MTKKINQAKLDKATRAMLGMGSLPDGYKTPKSPTPGERHKRFKMRVDRKGKGQLEELSP